MTFAAPWVPATSQTNPSYHILFVIAGLGAGGAEKVIALIANAWVAKGWRVDILAFDDPATPIFHKFDDRVRITRLNLSVTGGGFASMLVQGRRIRAIRRQMSRLRPDAVISMLTKINVLTLLAGCATSQRIIVSERNNPLAQQANAAWNAALTRLYPRAAAVVMQTRASMVCLPQMQRSIVKVIPNPISAPGGMAEGGAHVLTAAGRLTPQKGFDMLIDAFAKVAERNPQWSLNIWGEGEMRRELEAQVRRLGLEQRVRLPGTSKPGEWICDGGIMLLSSRYEGFPNVLGEAMAAGMPVVAYDCAFGPAEMITHGVDGVLVPPNDVDALAGAMAHLMNDPALRRRLGQTARRTAVRFAPEAIIGEWELLIGEVVGREAK